MNQRDYEQLMNAWMLLFDMEVNWQNKFNVTNEESDILYEARKILGRKVEELKRRLEDETLDKAKA